MSQEEISSIVGQAESLNARYESDKKEKERQEQLREARREALSVLDSLTSLTAEHRDGFARRIADLTDVAGKNPLVQAMRLADARDREEAHKVNTGSSSESGVVAGRYFVQSVASSGVLDVAWASGASGANVGTWSLTRGVNQQWDVVPVSGGMVRVRAVGSGLFLDLTFGRAVEGGNVQQWSANTSAAQLWVPEVLSDSSVVLRSAVNRDYVLSVARNGNVVVSRMSGRDMSSVLTSRFFMIPVSYTPVVSNVSVADGDYRMRVADRSVDLNAWNTSASARMSLWASNSGMNQVWRFTRMPGGLYRVVNAWSGLALDSWFANPLSGNHVGQWAFNNARNQLWSVMADRDGGVVLVNAATGSVLATDTSGSLVTTRSSVQRMVMRLEPQLSARQRVANLAREHRGDITDGVYSLGVKNTNLVVDVFWASRVNGANVGVWQANNNPNQLWRVTHDADGYVHFMNMNSGLYLDVTGANRFPGVNVGQWQRNDSLAQKWVIIHTNTGTRIMSALYPSIVLTTQSRTLSANISTDLDQNLDTQNWTLHKHQ